MPNLFNDEYENLASKGRYGDTMLAHINPQEATLLKSMGGAGTINPQTGLREFFSTALPSYFPALEPLPSLGQALDPASLATLSTQLDMETTPATHTGGLGFKPASEQIAPKYSQYADLSPALGMGGGRQVQGYTIPSDQTFQGKPLEAKYDTSGNFQYLGLAGGDYLPTDPNQPNIVSSPRINAKGEIIDHGVFDLSKQDDGSLGSFVKGLAKDFGPMILAALGANYLPSLFDAGAAGGATGGATGGTLAGMGTGAAGAAATTAATGIPLAALTAGGATTAGLAAGAGNVLSKLLPTIDSIKDIADVISSLDPTQKKSTTSGGSGGGLGGYGSLQFGQSFLPGSSYSAPESGMVKLKEQAIIPALAAVLQQRGMNVNQPSYAGGGRVHRPEFITGKTGHYAQGRGTGQSDDIPAVLHDGDYVVDADTVAAFGDGSSKAGAGALEQFRRSMPEHHSGGGQPIRAQIADGEYVLPAGFVTSLGRGSNKDGAKMLDAMREEIRAHKRSAPDTKIPPKAKKPVQYMREAMKG